MRRSSSDRRKIVLIACVAVLLALAEVVLKTRAETADVRIRILAVDRGSAALITDRDGRRLLVDDGADASLLESLAAWQPRTLAAMHGSSYDGDGATALRELAVVMREVLGPKAEDGYTMPTGMIVAPE